MPPKTRKTTAKSRASGKIQIQVLMKPKDRRDTGLNKLSEDELRNLNQWLNTNKELLGPGDQPQ